MGYISPEILYIKDKIEESIVTKKPLIFLYTKRNRYIPEERRVVFWELYSRNDHLYAVGYCLKRRDKRTFRLDRFKRIFGFDSNFDEEVPSLPPETRDVDPFESRLESLLEPSIDSTIEPIPVTKTAEEIAKKYIEELRGKRARILRHVVSFFILLIIGGGMVFGYIYANYPGIWKKVFGKKYEYNIYAPTLTISYLKIKGKDKNYKQKPPVNINRKYRGYTIEKKESYYRIKGSKERYNSLYDAIIKINTMVFEKTTGIKNEKLLSLYIKADKDKNVFLSWEEIKDFQNRINWDFKYINNDTALRPDDFLKEGGGDCEDWALFTAGLLRFWSYEPYIGTLYYKDKYHAITLVKVKELPYRFKGYKIASGELEGGGTIPADFYTFIDYYKVGRLTRAGGRKPELVEVAIPEWCYGRNM